MTPTADSLQGFRNRILNGGMVIDQRNAGASVTMPSAAYTLDRWRCDENTGGAATVQQVSDAPSGFNRSLRVTTTSTDTSLTGSEYMAVNQFIEGFNVADLGFGTSSAQTVTISFWVKSSLTGTFAAAIDNEAGNRAYVFNYAISSADTWQQKSVTIPGDTTGSWGTTTGRGIGLRFALGSGPDYQGTVGAWQSAFVFSSSGAVSVIGTLNATWQITGVQLEAGSVATPFERRPYGTELMLCQRYACSTFQQGVAWGQNRGQPGLYVLTQSTSARVSATFKFPVSMRATPTIVSYNPSRADSGWENLSTDVNVAATIAGVTDGLTTESAAVRTTSAASAVNNALVIHLSASAEL
jgi:hypothetical protein